MKIKKQLIGLAVSLGLLLVGVIPAKIYGTGVKAQSYRPNKAVSINRDSSRSNSAPTSNDEDLTLNTDRIPNFRGSNLNLTLIPEDHPKLKPTENPYYPKFRARVWAQKTRMLNSKMKRFAKWRSRFLYPKIGPNTRDLGGYPAWHGRMTQRDRLIRSAGLQNLSKSGLRELKHLHVTSIIDLRYRDGQNGLTGHPDPDESNSDFLKGSRIRYVEIPIYTHQESQDFNPKISRYGEVYYYGWPAVTDKNAINAYRTIFQDVINHKHGAILFHCNLGRDRTGTTSALLLSALGVSKNNIYLDYLLTDYYDHREKPYLLQKAELDHFYSTIDHHYGSVNHYLHRALKLGHGQLRKLRREYLTKNLDFNFDKF